MKRVDNFHALLSNYRWNGMTSKHTPVFVTYSFPNNREVPSRSEYQPYANDGYSGLTGAQKDNFRKAVAHYAHTAGIRFVEVDDPNDSMLEVMNTHGSDWGGWANYGVGTRSNTSWGYLVIDNSGPYNPGSYGYETILHELGHVSGLKHPFEGKVQLVHRLDNNNHTVMSYNHPNKHVRGLAELDVDALTNIYGGPHAVKSSWNWSFNDDKHLFKLSGSGKGDKLIGTDTDTHIDGKGGNDRIFGRDLDDVAHGGGGNDQFMLGYGDNKAIGGAGNDTFFDFFGDDVFNGGKGKDTVNFKFATSSVWVDLAESGAQWDLGRNHYRNIENLTGTNYGDTFFGTDEANMLKGGHGRDSLSGRAGADSLLGGKGNDSLDGGQGADMLAGGPGDDTLTGGDRADTFQFRPDQGADTIVDFVDGEDMLALYGFGYDHKSDALDHFKELGTDSDDQVRFTHKGMTIVINGADLADITGHDILI